MKNKSFNDVPIPYWIERIRGKACPICKSFCLTETKKTGSDPLDSNWYVLCTNCGTLFDETKWTKFEQQKVLSALEDEVPTNDLEAQSVNKPNLIILRANMLLEQESFEWVLQYIHKNIKNGVLLLPGYIDFVGAYEVDEDLKSNVIIQNWPNENPSVIN